MIYYILSVQDFFSRMYVSASAEQTMINRLFDYFLIMCLIIMIIVIVMVVGGSYRYRAKRRPETPEQVSGNKTIEIIWTVVPFLTLAFFFFLTLQIMKKIDRPLENQKNPDIDVIAHQYWWEIKYPAGSVTTANEMVIPSKKPLLIRFTSKDVIHNWWVMELGRKMDAIPGRYNFLWIEADREGTFMGTCGEYCGAQHAWMRIQVLSRDQENFDQWIAEQGKNFEPGNDSVTNAGLKLFTQKTCSNCHSIRGTGAKSDVGPDLTHLMSRKTLASGILANNPRNMRDWIADPQGIKPGSRMPNLMLNQNDLEIIVKLMEELK